MSRHYSDYFVVPQVYRANMTREIINESPDRWLDFCPHKKYIEFLEYLFEALHEGSKSVWLTGNYGTGKSNAALVTQKLYMDDFERVKQWFDHYEIEKINPQLITDLEKQRNEGTLVVYDYNAAGLEPTIELIVRIEKSIISQLNELGLKVPLNSNIERIIDRIRREDNNFFRTRDKIADQLSTIPSDINDIETIVKMIQNTDDDSSSSLHILDDIQKILHEDNIFLDVDVPSFKKWIAEIRNINHLQRILFIFDEFSDFIEENKTQLKTFEQITESPDVDQFYLIPVTHMGINAYRSDNADSASRSTNRFYFVQLQMPNDIAFQLAAHAMKITPELADEWKDRRDKLWSSVQQVADYFSDDEITHTSFYNILPIHPMAGYLLKTLSESVGANQRSIFEYLKGSANGKEFQEFIKVGGPEEFGKQLLTADYLWKYFMERDDLGKKKELDDVKLYYNKIRSSTYRGATDDSPTIRVLKAIMLYVLVSRLNKDGHARLQSTVENIELSFVGDGSIVNVAKIIKELEEQHCLSIMNGNIELYTSSINDASLQSQIEEYSTKFNELLAIKAQSDLTTQTKHSFSSNPAGRFEIRVTSKDKTSLQFLSQSAKEKFGKETGQICVWFSIAKNHEESIDIPEKIERILNQTKTDYRIIMINFDNVTFCDKDAGNWDEYVRLYVKYINENDTGIKNQIKKSLEKMEVEWTYRMKSPNTKFTAYYYNEDHIESTVCNWQSFKNFVKDCVNYMLPSNIDYVAPIVTAYATTALQKWATSGIDFSTADKQYKQVVQYIQNNGVTSDDNWFSLNPDHPYSQIHELLWKKIHNTIDRGGNFSIRKAFIDLRKAPYGLMENGISAFTIGFCLKDILKNNYQCTNGQLIDPLDINSLAEIIEDAIKSTEKPRSEKTICKLSKEDKSFIAKAPKMFKMSAQENSSTNDVIGLISEKVTQISSRVPLWVIPDYAESQNDPDSGEIRKIIEDICLISRTSSKGNTEEKSNAIREVGSILLEKESLCESIAKYMDPVTFKVAFEQYIDNTYPTMKEIASSVGDNTHYYLESILDKTAISASYLWIKNNLDANVSETISEYKVIQTMKPLVSPNEFINYKRIIESLKKSIFETNKIPRTLIVSSHPSLNELLNCVDSLDKPQTVETIDEIRQSIELNYDHIANLFYDTKMIESLRIIRSKVEIKNIPDNDLIDILGDLSSGYDSSEPIFFRELKGKIEQYEKESLGRKIVNRWKDLTQTETPSEWASNNHMPARYALYDCDDAKQIIDCIMRPGDYSSEKLNGISTTMDNCMPIDIKKCQEFFLDDCIPKKYRQFNINFGSVSSFLQKKYPGSPNNWPEKIDLSEFLSSQYKSEIAPQAISEIKKIDANELKSKILKLAEDNEDIGLLFWK